jgi:hypothetical protein
MRVAFADFDVVFRHAVQGIHGPTQDRDLLIFLAVYLRSALARYCLFHTSANWGIERSKVHLGELLRMPFALPEQTHSPKRNREIVREVAIRVRQAMEQAQQQMIDRQGIVKRVQQELGTFVYEYFDIDEMERALIEDTDNIVIRSILPKRASSKLPTLRESTATGRAAYTNLLCSTLNEWARGGPYQVQARVHVSSKSGVGVVVLNRVKQGTNPAAVPGETNDILPVLERLQKAFKKDLGSVELLRGLKVFDRETIYMIKPLSQRFWTRTAALNDADEIAAAILSHPAQEKA